MISILISSLPLSASDQRHTRHKQSMQDTQTRRQETVDSSTLHNDVHAADTTPTNHTTRVQLTAKDAEELNQQIAAATPHSQTLFLLAPLHTHDAELRALAHNPTPKIYANAAGVQSAAGRPPAAHHHGGAPRAARPPAAAAARPLSVDSAKRRGSFGFAHGPGGTDRSKRPRIPGNIKAKTAEGMASHLRPAAALVKEMLNHPLAKPFSSPVDPLAWPDYYTVVHDPIDLGTIQKQLHAGVYDSLEALAADVERVWENCNIYNGGVREEVCDMARQLKGIFDLKVARLQTKSAASRDSAKDKDDSTSVRTMKRQLADMKKQQEEMLKLLAMQSQLQQQQAQMGYAAPGAAGGGAAAPKPKKRRSAPGARAPRGGGGYAAGGAGAPDVATSAADESRDMSFEEKSALSTGINKLKSDNLGGVVSIIRANMPNLGNGSDEIEVDINALDRKTLWELHRFVNACLAKGRKARRAPAQTSAASRMSAAQHAQTGTERRLAQLQAGLSALDGGDGIALGGGGDVDSASDSDSDGDVGASLALTTQLSDGHAAHGGGGLYDEFVASKEASERQRLDSERQRQEQGLANARALKQKADLRAAELARQRAEQRERLNAGGADVDMLGQSAAMSAFEQEAKNMDFGIDEYGS